MTIKLANFKKILKQLTSPSNSLSHRAVRAAVWTFALRAMGQVFYFTRLVVLARVLSPDDIGLMGFALLALTTLESFTQTGFFQAMVQKRGDVKEYLDTAWTINGLRGLVLCVLLVLSAPYVGMFFNTPAAVPIVRVIAISFLIGGWSSMGLMYFSKEMELNKRFYYELGGKLADFIVAIVAVLILRNVWALVFGLLAGEITRLVLSYCLHPYRPRFRFEWAKIRELSGFGKWIMASSFLFFILTNGDSIVVGRLLAASALGFYQMAYRIANAPTTEITYVIAQVAFPAYSKLQDNLLKLREAYLKVLQLTAFISIPLAMAIFVLAPEIVQIFLGQKWMPMVPVMQVLAVTGLIQSVSGTASAVINGVGKPRLNTIWQVVRLVVSGALIYPLAIRWGILGVSLAVGFGILVSSVGAFINAVRITGCGVKNFFKLVGFPLISGIMTALFVFALKAIIHETGLGEFVLFAGLGILFYLAVVYLLDKLFGYKLRLLIRETWASLRGF